MDQSPRVKSVVVIKRRMGKGLKGRAHLPLLLTEGLALTSGTDFAEGLQRSPAPDLRGGRLCAGMTLECHLMTDPSAIIAESLPIRPVQLKSYSFSTARTALLSLGNLR